MEHLKDATPCRAIHGSSELNAVENNDVTFIVGVLSKVNVKKLVDAKHFDRKSQ